MLLQKRVIELVSLRLLRGLLNACRGLGCYTVMRKAWGWELWVTNGPLYCLKVLFIDAGWQCSLHRHIVKDETFFVLAGETRVECYYASADKPMVAGDRLHVSPGVWHRFGSQRGAVLLEVSSQHREADVERKEPSKVIP